MHTRALCFLSGVSVREMDAHGRSLSGLAFQLEPGAVVLRGVADDGKAETRAADLLGVALVDTVEALEDAALVGIRDADAGIHDGERDGLPVLPDGDGDGCAA